MALESLKRIVPVQLWTIFLFVEQHQDPERKNVKISRKIKKTISTQRYHHSSDWINRKNGKKRKRKCKTITYCDRTSNSHTEPFSQCCCGSNLADEFCVTPVKGHQRQEEDDYDDKKEEKDYSNAIPRRICFKKIKKRSFADIILHSVPPQLKLLDGYDNIKRNANNDDNDTTTTKRSPCSTLFICQLF
ncbi:hypothetical protein RFI_34549 [Reticulomyxa filosa]|uniref:Uncharacterized protein n=1 Tax=Reticulomyxa filosa TaxID=46433 RepID=X6LQ80_RETFI|nr:hypothetical protein RFI_34549 [Reticulomyxa filosa]|eukprot:ETO02865.1 hypothetical protein RFI_34549 [Reticulomyxa filosa]